MLPLFFVSAACLSFQAAATGGSDALAAAKADYEHVMDTDVANFNKLAAGRGLKPLSQQLSK